MTRPIDTESLELLNEIIADADPESAELLKEIFFGKERN